MSETRFQFARVIEKVFTEVRSAENDVQDTWPRDWLWSVIASTCASAMEAENRTGRDGGAIADRLRTE
jgi:hypothetical protein